MTKCVQFLVQIITTTHETGWKEAKWF